MDVVCVCVWGGEGLPTYTIFAGEAVGEAKKGSGKEKAGEHAGF